MAQPPTEALVLEALRRVQDPDRGQDIVALGMVKGLVLKDGNVFFSIEVDAKRGPGLEPMRKAAEKASEISADQLERAEKELDKLTHDTIEHIDKALARKEQELLEV